MINRCASLGPDDGLRGLLHYSCGGDSTSALLFLLADLTPVLPHPRRLRAVHGSTKDAEKNGDENEAVK